MLHLLLLASIVLTGTVREADTGRPVPGAQVRAETNSWPVQVKAQGVSDGTGAYRLELPDGSPDVRLVAEAEGYAGWQFSMESFRGNGRTERDILIRRAVGVRGIVVDDQTGLPVSGVPIEPLSSRWSRGKRSLAALAFQGVVTQTDSGGRFEFTKLPPGEYALELGPSPGMTSEPRGTALLGYPPMMLPASASQGESIKLRVGNSADLGNVRMRRQRFYTVSGNVEATCSGKQGVWVSLEPRARRLGPRTLAVKLECGGDFSFSNVAPGAYRIAVTPEGFGGGPGVVQVIEVTENDMTIKLVPRAPVEIQGQVVWPSHIEKMPAQFLSILQPRPADGGASSYGGIERYPGLLKPDGLFTIRLLPGREYRPEMQDRLADGFYVKEILYNGTDARLGLRPDSAAPQQTLKIVVSDQAARLEGTVNPGPARRGFARVFLMPWPPEMADDFPVFQTADTDLDSKFVLKNLRPGAYRVFASSDRSGKWDEPGVLMRVARQARDLEVRAGQTTVLTLDRIEP